MLNTIEIASLSRTEKLMVMEAIWDDLSSDEEAFKSPSWHKTVLQQTEERLKLGSEEVLDWSVVKKTLRAEFE
ncbi:MAG TPA: acyl-protein synthetase [Psychromonas hadalis]|nr:acyl-protein synthetase [Psychromonas hadalis]